MSDFDLTELYKELRHGGYRLSPSSQLITSCEAELSELIKQIDLLFKAKKNEWYKEKATLELTVETKDRENHLQQECLERKNAEIARLREHVSETEKADKQLITDYQQQVEKLHDDLRLLRKHYDKMRNKHQKEKIKLRAENIEKEANANNMEKRQLENEVTRLHAQLQSMKEKCEVMEEQGSAYQEQLSRRRIMIGDIEASLRSELSQVKSQLRDLEDREAERNVEGARLRADVTYWKNKWTKCAEELSLCERAVRDGKSACQKLQTQNTELKGQLRSQAEELQRSCDAGHHQQEIARLRQLITDKDKSIRMLTEWQQRQQQQQTFCDDSMVNKLRIQLERIDQEYKGLQDKENDCRRLASELKTQCDDLKTRLYQTDQECVSLRHELHSKTKELMDKEQFMLRRREDELSEFERMSARLEALHQTEVESIRSELDACREQLAQTIRNSVAAAGVGTQDLRSSTDSPPTSDSSTAAELRLASIQLDSMTAENNRLRNQVASFTKTESELRIAHKQLEDARDQHKFTVSRLQLENERLQQDLKTTKEKMSQAQDIQHLKYRRLLSDLQTDLERRESNLRHEQQMLRERDSMDHSDSLLNRESMYNMELSYLQAHRQLLMQQLDTAQQDLLSSNMLNESITDTNQVLGSFAVSISDALESSSHHHADQDVTQYRTVMRQQSFRSSDEESDPMRRIAEGHQRSSTLAQSCDRASLQLSITDTDRSHSFPSDDVEDDKSARAPHSPYQRSLPVISHDVSSPDVADGFLCSQRQRVDALESLFNQHLDEIRANQVVLRQNDNAK